MIDVLDAYIKTLFLKDTVFTLKNKVFKKGKLINFKISGCYISFVINTEKKKETFEIPFPFNVFAEENNITFDYRLKSLAEQDIDLLVNLKATTQIKRSKFYDTSLVITSLN